jgi:hypothetical protein
MARTFGMVLTCNDMHARPLLLAVIVSALPALASSGCAARRFNALMQSWQGHTVDDLFRTWGRPVYLYSDGGGGRIAVYVPRASAGAGAAVTNAAGQPEALRVYDPRMTDAWPIFRIFFIDNAGRITRSRWRGQWECCSS